MVLTNWGGPLAKAGKFRGEKITMKKLLSVLMLPIVGITLSLVAPIANAQEKKAEEKKAEE
ncbi:MAG: hypothetical protein HY238_25175, partial [Acidobacteria bacterium]|nr:hypothetical protein [Acidobacteriota bacterium]